MFSLPPPPFLPPTPPPPPLSLSPPPLSLSLSVSLVLSLVLSIYSSLPHSLHVSLSLALCLSAGVMRRAVRVQEPLSAEGRRQPNPQNPQVNPHSAVEISAHTRKSRPDSGLGLSHFLLKVLTICKFVPSPLGKIL